MATWSGILQELSQTVPPQFDPIRRRYLRQYSEHVGRSTILYATSFTQNKAADPQIISINDEDVQGLMEVTQGLGGGTLDIILHSPGGSIDAVEGFVDYLRSRFDNIRVVVPHLAMSAATMICCASDEIFMGKHSFLGPVDPQFFLPTSFGPRPVAAQALLDQFKKAMDDCADPQKINGWIPILGQYGPDLLIKAENSLSLSRELVATWLQKYMFAGEADAETKGKEIAETLADHGLHKSHGRHFSRERVSDIGLKVNFLEADEVMQDLALSVFHATTHAFSMTPAIKIIENQHGRAFLKTQQPQAQSPFMQPQFPFAPTPTFPQGPGPGMPQPPK